MLTLEQSTENVIATKGLFAIPPEAFQFNWDILYRVWTSTFRKWERFCPRVLTIQTAGGNPVKMPDNCIYPRAIGFGNSSMIAPQSVPVERSSWSYDRETNLLSVFTNTGTSAQFKVQYLATYDQIEYEPEVEPYEVFDGEEIVEIQLVNVPEPTSFKISKGSNTLDLVERTRDMWKFEGSLGAAVYEVDKRLLTISQSDTTAGMINLSYTAKYKAYDYKRKDDDDFFETWYAANLLTSLGNIKAILRMDMMPNTISADDLIAQGRELMNEVIEWQKAEKSKWWRGYISARV